MEEKYYSIMILHAVGDTIGFKNGDWEFNYHDKDKLDVLDYVNELIYEFIYLGGVNGIDLSDWKVSDDTFFHIAIAKSMLKYKGNVTDKLITNMKSNLLKEAVKIWDESSGKETKTGKTIEKFNRYIGVKTSENIKKFTDNFDARLDTYDDYAGGNGAAMRSLVIGMCLYGKKNRDKLIDLSIISSQLTHNNAIGYLAGFTAALFTALALEDIPIAEWPYILIEYLKTNKLKSFLNQNNVDQAYDHSIYIRYWQKYIDTKFDDKKKPLKLKANSNPMHRIRYYHDNFYKDTISTQIGSSGYLCMIMAYDALLDCDGKWEKLIVYSMLHSGDSDTIGAIAGGLYGAVYGMGDVPSNMIEHLERKNELEKLSSELYKKFNK
jgi:ADP-ribosylglycohydrolase